MSDKELQIVQWGIQNGKTRAETEEALKRYKLTGSPADPNKPPEVKKESLASRISQDITKSGEDVYNAFTQPNASSIKQGVEATAKAIGAPIKVASEFLPEGVRNILGTASEKIGEGVGTIVDKISDLPAYKRYAEKYPDVAKSPAVIKAFEEALGIASPTGEIAGNILLAEGGGVGVNKVGTGIKTGTEIVKNKITNTADEAVSYVSNIRNDVQNAVASKNVNPQLKESVNRLFLQGTKRVEDPIATYDNFLAQSKKAIGDTKADPAIAVVGEKIGDSFSKVIKQRQEVGKVIQEELKKIGNIKTNVLPTIDSFVKSLSDEGLVYDRVKKTISQKSRQTKVNESDLQILETYSKELQKLGSNPTIGELDSFISRISSDIDLYKSKNNIVGSTNGERIIKNSLSDLRKQFDPQTTGNKDLQAYSSARKAYSELSSFIEEGSPFLGKKTQSGDFAKDASLAKSAVQSVLNQGKKDWLIKLEELTGYNALDESVLALQAMKDAGDFRGLSILQQISEGAIPTSKAGFTQKVLDFGIEQGSKILLGSPEEQTRAFLRSLKQ